MSDQLAALQRSIDAAKAARVLPPACTCVVGICKEDDEDGCCESEHCPATRPLPPGSDEGVS